MFCCLRRNVEASCHKHFAVVSREQQTTPLTSDECHKLSCHGPAILCVLHLAVESLTTRSGARYWRRIVMFAYSTCVRRPRQGGGFPSEYCYNVWYMEMPEWSRVWIPNGEKILKLR